MSPGPRQARSSPEVEAGYARIGEEPSWAYSERDEWREDDNRERQRDFEATQRGGL